MNKSIKIFTVANLITLCNCLGQTENISLKDSIFKDYEIGTLKDGYKVGVWEYYDKYGELSLKVNYDNAQLLYLIPDTSDYVIQTNDGWVNSKLDMQPQYIGSMVEFYKILNANIRYPVEAWENGTAGQFYITFEIDSLGHANNYKVINDIGDKCSEETIRVLKLVPNLWLSATKGKRKYASRFILPVNFKMELDGKEVKGKNKKNNAEMVLPLAKALEAFEIKSEGFTGSKQLLSFQTEEENYTIVETMPSFPGGEGELLLYIRKNFEYPSSAKQDNIHGKVYVRFIVNKLGEIKDVKIVKGIRNDVNKAVKDVILKMPKWKPGLQNGRPVNVYYNLPVSF